MTFNTPRPAVVLAWFVLASASILSGCASTPAVSPAKISVAQDRGEVSILWGSTSRPAPLPPLEHAAMLIPIAIEGLDSRPLYMQFDLGHPSTVIYSNKWADIARRIRIAASTDKIAEMRFSLGTLTATGNEIAIMKRDGPGIDWAGTGIEIIGTVGADLIDGRTVVLDFKTNTITLARSRAGLARDATLFQTFSFQGRRIMLPVTFEGQTTQIMYDSGSSAFAWLTNESAFKRLARNGAVPVAYPIRSWDKTLTAHTVATDAVVKIGGVMLNLGEVSRIEGMGALQEAAISVLGIGGMAGNKLFLGHKLIIDTGRLEFAIED